MILLLALTSLPALGQETIAPFSSDGCSKWPEGNVKHPDLWRECCYIHDISYWMGGTKAQRLEADQGLRACVKSKGATVNSFLMYLGVRTGGGPLKHTSYRWGYGWPTNRPYSELSEAEKKLSLKNST